MFQPEINKIKGFIKKCKSIAYVIMITGASKQEGRDVMTVHIIRLVQILIHLFPHPVLFMLHAVAVLPICQIVVDLLTITAMLHHLTAAVTLASVSSEQNSLNHG